MLKCFKWKLEDPKIDFVVRLVIAVPLATIGFIIFVQGLRGGGYSAVFVIPLATLFFILAALPLAPWIAERIAAPTGGLFFPDKHFAQAQPKYSLAEGKRVQCQFYEAIEEYEHILAEHPGDPRCFVGMLDIATTELRDPTLARRIFARGKEEVPAGEGRRQLEDAYNELMSDFR